MTRIFCYLLLLCFFFHACSKGDGSETDRDSQKEHNTDPDPEPCDGVIIVSLDSVESVTASISWTSSASFSAYQLEYGPGGFALGQGKRISASDTEITLENLDPNSEYELYLRGTCGSGESDWTAALPFSTLCNTEYYNGLVNLESQEQVNAFGALCYSGINGTLRIRSNVSGDLITDLSPLNGIIEVTGDLIIQINPELASLEGLESIESVNNLRVWGNEGLTSLKGLDGLREITGLYPTVETDITPGIEINSNFNLVSLEGLERIERAGRIYIWQNSDLISLKGLDNLKTVDQDLVVSNNNSLHTLEALSNLVEVHGNFEINSLPNILSLEGLEQLETVGLELSIFNNKKLVSIEAIQNLTSVRDLSVQNSPALLNLTGLNIDVVSGSVWITSLPITSLTGISGTSTTAALRIRYCHELTTMEGLEAISDLGSLLILDNYNLINFNGLDSLVEIVEEIRIERNRVLADFCGLSPIFGNGSFTGNWLLKENLLNPTLEAMQSGNCN